MPEDKMPSVSLGRADEISSMNRLPWIDRMRTKLWSNVDPRTENNIKTALKVASSIFSPESVGGAGSAANASIAMLSKSKEASKIPGLREALEYTAQRYPRLSRIGKESRFVDELPGNVVGEFDPVSGLANIALSKGGQTRSLADVLRTVGHELIGHGRQVQRGMRDYPVKESYKGMEVLRMPKPQRKYLDSINAEQKMPYASRPTEIDANRRGEQLVRALTVQGQMR